MKPLTDIRHHIIYSRPQDVMGYFGWPSIARLDDGTLIVGASGFRHRHVCPWGVTTLFVSHDDGETWSDPFIIHDSPLDDRDVGIIHLKNQIVMATWFTLDPRQFRDSFEKWPDGEMKDRMRARLSALTDASVQEHAGSWTRVSFDGGKTWSVPHRAPVSTPHGPILMKNGTLLYFGKQFPTEMNRPWGEVAAAVSLDYGLTWKEIGTVPLPEGMTVENFHEPHVYEAEDGRLVGMIRHQELHGFADLKIYQTESLDGGKTWSVPVLTEALGAPPHLLMHSDGPLIMTYGCRREPFGPRVMLSRDEGRTWYADLPIRDDAPNTDLGYPATVELGDKSLLTVYYQAINEGENTSLLCSRWRLPEED